MKHLVLGLLLLALVAAFSVINYNFIEKSLTELLDTLDRVKDVFAASAYADADEFIASALGQWEKNSHYYKVVLRHTSIDEISVTLNNMKACIDSRDASQFSQYYSEAVTLIKSVIWVEALSIDNLL